MIFQFLEKMPSFFSDENGIFLDMEYDGFFEELENFFNDYEEIVENITSEKLDKYKITKSLAFNEYKNLIKKSYPFHSFDEIIIFRNEMIKLKNEKYYKVKGY